MCPFSLPVLPNRVDTCLFNPCRLVVCLRKGNRRHPDRYESGGRSTVHSRNCNNSCSTVTFSSTFRHICPSKEFAVVIRMLYSPHMYSTIASIQAHQRLVVILSMTLPMLMIVLQEHIFVSAINRKSNSRDAQTWEAALKSIPSRETSRGSPCLAIRPPVSPVSLLGAP